MNIAVAGTGYVGMSIATLLAQHNHFTAVDVIPEKVEKINNRISPIQDEYIEKYLAEKNLDLSLSFLWSSKRRRVNPSPSGRYLTSGWRVQTVASLTSTVIIRQP